MNNLLLYVTAAYLFLYAIRTLVDVLNWRHALAAPLPVEFQDVVDQEKFRKSQNYLADSTKFQVLSRSLFVVGSLAFLWGGGFVAVDNFVWSFGYGPIVTALLYFLVLGVFAEVISLPLNLYHTFGLEERYGFNRTSMKTFWVDQVKGWMLGLLLGGAVLAGIFWFFSAMGNYAWAYAWGALAVFQIVLMFLAPVVLMPLFNKFDPLPDGELKSEIEAYAKRENFQLQGIFTMDGSKRSTRANAFFTGFGRFRRIVLFDTLVQQHSVKELVAVLAHEVGHFKKKHIPKMIAISLLTTLVLFYLLNWVMQSPAMMGGFGFERPSLQAGFTVAAWLYPPLSFLMGLVLSSLSRKHEYEADAFAAETTGDAPSLAAALKRLSVENLSNLNPHPWKVALEYSHPPVTARMRELASRKARAPAERLGQGPS